MSIWAQQVFFQYNVGGYTVLNKLKSNNWTKKEVKNYYKLKPVTGTFISFGIGARITERQAVMISRKSIGYGVGGEFRGGFTDKLGGGLSFLDRARAEWNLAYSYELVQRKKACLILNTGVNYLKRETGWLPQLGSGYIGNDSNRYWVKVVDSDSFYLKSFRLITGFDFTYEINKHWKMGLNLGYQFGGKPIFERSVKIVDSRLSEPLQFREICNGRSIFFQF